MDPRLPLKIQENIHDLGGLTRQVLRGAKSNEMLMQAAKNFAGQENTTENSAKNMRTLRELTSHLQFQAEAIERRVEKATARLRRKWAFTVEQQLQEIL